MERTAYGAMLTPSRHVIRMGMAYVEGERGEFTVKGDLYTKEEEIRDISIRRPHVVILGAWASLAACPNGDKRGRKLPLMCDLIDTLDLGKAFDEARIEYKGRNFEEVYGAICGVPTYANLTRKVEVVVSEYFRKLELPDVPTIYDYLVMSLREKDVIATFNWDPFLYQALERNHRHTHLPQFVFLHGCSTIGYCHAHMRQGKVTETCPECKQLFSPTKLLYPVANKDYVSDPYIKSQWESLKPALAHAFLFTVFGYGAPVTDAAAVHLMGEAWGWPEDRRFEEVEIIDTASNAELFCRWERFIHSSHYKVSRQFNESLLASHPRRTCEAMYQSMFSVRFCEENPIPGFSSFEEMWNWFQPLLEHE